MLLDRAEDADELHVVLKMDSGYNVGIAIDQAEVELLERGEKPEINLPPLEIEKDPEKKWMYPLYPPEEQWPPSLTTKPGQCTRHSPRMTS